MLGAEILVTMLAGYGVEKLFGVPGQVHSGHRVYEPPFFTVC